MGKSSFIQNLLIFRQSRDLGNGRVDLKGSHISIGTTKDALYQYKSNDESFSTHIQFTDSSEIDLSFEYKVEADYFISRNLEEGFEAKVDDIKRKKSLFNDNFQYLEAERQAPSELQSKSYSTVVNGNNVGNNGEFTAHYIETYGNESVQTKETIHKDSYIEDSTTGEKIVNKSLLNQINLWMREISPNISIHTTSVSSNHVKLEYDFIQRNLGFTNKFIPENVGFGITYVLPVVVSLLKAKAGDLLIIENPESHLHPRGQAEIGRLIALTAMSGVQVIIETHSDHLINGIRVAVKEKALDREKVVLFFSEKVFATNEQYSKFTDIEIDKNGELSQYPNNLLEEWSNQLFNLI
ncbi:MAG: putative ATPase [Flammeovirgaceae bacterium]|jgi:predicted ATPase